MELKQNLQDQLKKGFWVGDVFIEWGTCLRDIDDLLKNHKRFKIIDKNWSRLRCEVQNVLGFSTLEFSTSAPIEDKPIAQAWFELLPESPINKPNPHFWAKPLINVLGESHKLSINDTDSSSSVAYYATWNFDPIEINLSIFGGLRENDNGISAGAFIVEYKDIIALAKDCLAKNEAKESELFGGLEDLSEMFIYTFPHNLRPFFVADYTLQDPNIAEKDDLLRQSQRAYYKTELLETPDFMKHKLAGNQFAIWFLHDKNQWFVSTKWDTQLINKIYPNTISLTNILPAKGGGAMYLSVGDLSITTNHSSEVLIDAFHKLEEIVGEKLPYREDYDC